MINYPNGKSNKVISSNNLNKATVKKEKKTIPSAANRGMDFEHAVNVTNDFYQDKGRAMIIKRPTPIKIVKVDYSKMKIVEAYFEKQSTTDYNGVYKGKYIDFECKETKSKTSLSFHNIPSQQIHHLKGVLNQGGIAFFLIYFTLLDEIYLVDSSIIIQRYEDKKGRKSISIDDIRLFGHKVEQGYIPRIKYLDIVDKVYF
jgi:recombination protein U